MKTIIEIKDVKKTFRTHEQIGTGFLSSLRKKKIEKRALRGVSLTIKEGDIMALLGKNGSGKSTLIKLLVGIMPPDSGSVTMLGMEPWKERIKLAMHFGVVLGAHPVLFQDLPASDSFEYMRKIYQIPKELYRQRLNYLLELMELKDVYKRQVREMSLGESMKCNFIAAVLHQPEIVILDEPTIGVDLPSMLNLRQAILDLNKRYKMTFLISTHILEDVRVLAEKVTIINKGLVVFSGSKEKLTRMFGEKKVVELYYDKEPKGLLSEGKLIKKRENYAKIEIDAKMIKDPKFSKIIADRNVEDYNITDPDISYILERFYKGIKEEKEEA